MTGFTPCAVNLCVERKYWVLAALARRLLTYVYQMGD